VRAGGLEPPRLPGAAGVSWTSPVAHLAVMQGQPDLPAPTPFVFANLVVGLVALGTLWLLVRGQLKLEWTAAPVAAGE